MGALISLGAVAGLALLAAVGASAGDGLRFVLGVIVPGVAFAVFLGGIIYRVVHWAKSPVPFRIPTTTGQEKSLPWVRNNELENPSGLLGVIGRMALEVLAFRSLFRNTRVEVLADKEKVNYIADKALWAAALAFHWAMLIVLVRHLRLFVEPVPAPLTWLQEADGFLQIGVPVIFATTFLFLGGLAVLLARRVAIPQLRYISLANDYFPLFLLLGIGLSGLWLRHLAKTDMVGVKELVVGLVRFSPSVPELVSPLFYGHLVLVCALLLYFPFSKLMHMAGVFLSPTRNMANTNRRIRHVNPWDYPVKLHPYEAYEDEFRDKMKAANLPVDKE
jgi:nitrate reductase gamma subunit